MVSVAETKAGVLDMVSVAETKVGVLDKAMTILRVFDRGDAVLSPQELATRTGLPLPTVYRLAQALADHGMLDKDGPGFRLGMTLLHLGALVSDGIDLRRTVMRYLHWLNERTGENAELHLRRGDARIPVECVQSPQNLRPFVEIGAPLALHMGASGKVLLAWLSPDECDALVTASVARFGGGHDVDRQALHAQLADVRAAGWAASDSERAAGIAAIAAPLWDASGTVVGALAVTAPSMRLAAMQRDLYVPLVREAAARASSDLGYVHRRDDRVNVDVREESA